MDFSLLDGKIATAPLVDSKRFAKLIQEKDQLLKAVVEMGSVGDALLIELDEDFRKEHGYGRFGRVTFSDDDIVIKTAPSIIIREPTFIPSDKNMMVWGSQMSYGEKTHTQAKDWCKSIGEPEFLHTQVKVQSHKTRATVEHALLSRLIQGNGSITLVDPSFSTMAVMQSLGPAYVTVSSGDRRDFINGIKDFIKKGGDRLEYLGERQVIGVAYMGSTQLKWIPPTEPYVYLVNSPFYSWRQEGKPCSVTYSNGVYRTETMRKPKESKEYSVVSVLDLHNDADWLYNPETVDAYLGVKNKMFFLRSNFPLRIQEVETDQVTMHPHIIRYEGEWHEISGQKWLINSDDKIVDVIDSQGGTYYSRRSRLTLPGKQWAPYVKSGTHRVTACSIHPQETGMMHIVENGVSSFTLPVEFVVIDQINEIYPDEGKSFVENATGDILLDNGKRLSMAAGPGHKVLYEVTRGKSKWITMGKQDQMIYYEVTVNSNPFEMLMSDHLYRYHSCLRTWNMVYFEYPKNVKGDFFAFGSKKDLSQYVIPLRIIPHHEGVSTVITFNAEDQGIQCKEEIGTKAHHTIYTELIKRDIIDWNCSGVDIYRVSDLSGKTLPQVKDFMLRARGAYFWSIHPQQIVHADKLLINLEGNFKKGFCDGRLLRDVLWELEEGKRLFKFTYSPNLSFLNFLRVNGMTVISKIAQYGYEVIVKHWKRS